MLKPETRCLRRCLVEEARLWAPALSLCGGRLLTEVLWASANELGCCEFKPDWKLGTVKFEALKTNRKSVALVHEVGLSWNWDALGPPFLIVRHPDLLGAAPRASNFKAQRSV